MGDRDIVMHVDGNSFYASVECAQNPDLYGKAVAVCGDPKLRHGIVLARSEKAKRKGVKTAQTIAEAIRLCPDMILLPPDYQLYVRYSRLMRRILHDMTDYVEPYGLDEAWIKVRARDYAEAERIADDLRARMYDELGITVSVGVSFNKPFAKLGSDYKKPNATTVITEDNFREKVWGMPAGDLIFVGGSTAAKLERYGIVTIGGLARAETDFLVRMLGKNGLVLKQMAMGQDVTPVMGAGESLPLVSVSNSITPPHDICNLTDAKSILYLLVESVAMRMRGKGMAARCVGINARGSDMAGRARQVTLPRPTQSTGEIARAAVEIYEANFKGNIIRSVGVSCTHLTPCDIPRQMDMLGEEEDLMRREALDMEIDAINRRFGRCVERGIVHANREFAKGNPSAHVNPSPGYFTGKVGG